MNLSENALRRRYLYWMLLNGPFLRTVNYFIVRYLPRLVDYGFFYPYHADIEITTRCNLQCTYCSVPFMDTSQRMDLTFAQLKTIIEDLPYLVSVKLQGRGETFLNADAMDMVEYLVKKNIVVFTYTNGTLLNPALCHRIINSKMHAVYFSLDGDKETHTATRMGCDYDAIIASIRRLVEIRGFRTFPRLYIWCVVNQHNYQHLNELLEICHHIGVDKVTLQTRIYPSQLKGVQSRRQDVGIDKHHREPYISRAQELAEDLGLALEVFSDIDNPCLWPWTSCFITCDGFVLPCCLIESPELIQMGNVKTESFRTIWRSKKYHIFRKRIKSRDFPEVCAVCSRQDAG